MATTARGARLLYPQLILETMQANALRDDGSDILAIWEQMIAVSRNINGTKVDQPIIDTTAPEGGRSGRIAQLAEPETIVSITTGDKSYRIPTNSIGLMISDEAMHDHHYRPGSRGHGSPVARRPHSPYRRC